MSLNRIELRWPGKDDRPKLEPRVLIPVPALSFGEKNSPNLLVRGDNLLALKALEQRYSGIIQMIYIDPPYNTGSAFAHFDDGFEHSIWLGLMRERLELLKGLLAPTGIIFVQIDDGEQAYLKVLMDEVFGRKNFTGQIVWEKKKKPSFLNSNMGVITEYILSYAKDRQTSPAFICGVTTEGKKYPFNNGGNGVKILTFPAKSVLFRMENQIITPMDMSEGNIITRLLDTIAIKDGTNENAFRLEGEWRYSQSRLDEIVSNKEQIVISKIPFRPNHIKAGGEEKKMKNLLTIAHYQMATYEDSSKESIALFGETQAFDYPKPEALIRHLIEAVTSPDDFVLDSFAGSGTTGAVAHKLNRRWIMIEMGEHCETHIVPRLKKVIEGQDQGGISSSCGWNGGGGFRFCRVAPSLLKRDEFGNWIINSCYNPEMLAEAVCKLEGFTYAPSKTDYWRHGQSTERDFIYVTTQTLTHSQLQALSAAAGTERTLLVMCSAYRGDPDTFTNLTVKKIPKSVQDECEWDKDDYSLTITNPIASVDDSVNVVAKQELEVNTPLAAQPASTPAKRRGRPPKVRPENPGQQTIL